MRELGGELGREGNYLRGKGGEGAKNRSFETVNLMAKM